MSGICAVYNPSTPDSVKQSLVTIRGGLCGGADERLDYRLDVKACAGIGISARFRAQQIDDRSSVIVACDTALYNEAALAQMAGVDTVGAELMAALYERFGGGFVEKLEGGFSIVLWDRRTRTMLAAVDGFGIKRLSYCHSDVCSRVFISSRADTIAALSDVDNRINPAAIANILNFSSNLGPDTIFRGVRRIPPGYTLQFSNGMLRLDRHWDLQYAPTRSARVDTLSHELESAMQTSVALHCKDDPSEQLGAFLSGGTDSSTVVGMMSRLQRGPVKAFSIGFQEESFNELEYAILAANRFSAEHYTYRVTADDCFEALPSIIHSFDEPFGNSSAIPTYFCARMAHANGVRALLAGDGGDELFGGNERYRTDKIFEVYQYIPAWVRRGVIETALRHAPMEPSIVNRGRSYVRRANIPNPDRFFSYHFLCTHSPEEVFDAGFLESLNGYSVLDVPRRHYESAPCSDHLNKLLYLDAKITLADNDLPKVTCMSELAGIETRFPFLSRPIADLAGAIPSKWKVKGFEKRYLFKRAFRQLLPEQIIRKRKHGFGIPVAEWMKTHRRMRELTRDTLVSQRAMERGYFRRSFIEGLFRKHQEDASSYYGDTLWTALVLELWQRNMAERRTTVAYESDCNPTGK